MFCNTYIFFWDFLRVIFRVIIFLLQSNDFFKIFFGLGLELETD
jgi:hypothetical protein